MEGGRERGDIGDRCPLLIRFVLSLYASRRAYWNIK